MTESIALPTDPDVLRVLRQWPSVELLPGNAMSSFDAEIRMDVLAHLARCAFRQNQDQSDYSMQEGVAGAVGFLARQKVSLSDALTDKITYYPNEYRTGLELAFMLKDISIAKALISAVYSPWSVRDGNHPMFNVCAEIYVDRGGDICERMDLAKTIGWSPEMKSANGNTALHLCARNFCMELNQLQQVAEYYARAGQLHRILEEENKAGHTPLVLALLECDGLDDLCLSKIGFLLDCGADPKHVSSVSGLNFLGHLAQVCPQLDKDSTRNQYRALLKRLFEVDGLDASGISSLAQAANNHKFLHEAVSVQTKGLANPDAINAPPRL